MTSRNSKKGGRVPPDGRAPQPPGVGAQARRHDLEAPATPGLHGSDLQYGDVSRLEQAQQVAPIGKKTQQPNPGRNVQAQGGGQGGGGRDVQIPDPIDLAVQRNAGTLGSSVGGGQRFDPTPWVGFLGRLASSPNASSGLAAAFMTQAANAMRVSSNPTSRVIDMNALDDAVEAGLG